MAEERSVGVSWRRVAIEFLIIVAGVMVALATDRWTASLDNRKREHKHLEQLQTDFRANLDIANWCAGYKNKLAQSASSVLAVIKGTEARESRGPFPVDVELAGWNHAPHYLAEAWQDLLSTGDVRLLRSSTLRSEVARFYQKEAVSRDYEEEWRSYIMAYRASVTPVLDPYLRLRILQLFNTSYLTVEDSLGARDNDAIITQRLRQLPEVPGKLTDAIMAHRAGANRCENDAEQVEKILAVLEREIGSGAAQDIADR